MFLSKKIFFLVSIYLLCLKAFAGTHDIAGFSATLIRSPRGGGGNAAWAASGLAGIFGFPGTPVLTGLSSPIEEDALTPMNESSNLVKGHYKIAVSNENFKISKSLIQKALNDEKQSNVLIYKIEIGANLKIKNPKLLKNSFNKTLDKNGKYHSDFFYTYNLGL